MARRISRPCKCCTSASPYITAYLFIFIFYTCVTRVLIVATLLLPFSGRYFNDLWVLCLFSEQRMSFDNANIYGEKLIEYPALPPRATLPPVNRTMQISSDFHVSDVPEIAKWLALSLFILCCTLKLIRSVKLFELSRSPLGWSQWLKLSTSTEDVKSQ